MFLCNILFQKKEKKLFQLIEGLLAFDQFIDRLRDLCKREADLFHGVAVTQGCGCVLFGVVVDGDTDRCSDLVLAAVPASDGSGVVVLGLDAFVLEFCNEFAGDLVEAVTGHERKNGCLNRGDTGLEPHNGTGFAVGFVFCVGVFEHHVADAVNTVGGFDDVRHDIFAEYIDHLVFDGVHLRRDNDLFTVNGEVETVGLGFGGGCFHEVADGLCFAAVNGTHLAEVGHNCFVVDLLCFGILNKDGHLFAGNPGVGFEVVVGTVGDTDDLNPAEPVGVGFGVPAVGCVVCTFVGHMLAEPDFVGVESDGAEDVVGHCHIVGNVFVCDDSFVNCLPHGFDYCRCVGFLLGDSAERHGVVGVAVKERVVLFVRVNKDLGFCLGELTEADHSLTRGDFVAVGFPDLDCTEREVVAVEPEKTREVDEHTLCGFGTEVTFPLSSGADAGGEHEVEVEDVNGSEDFSAGGAFFVLENFVEFFFGHGSCVRDTECFGDVVGTEEFLAVRALEHFVGEAADVAACDVDRLDTDGGAFDFVVAFLYDVEVAPDVFNPAFHHCAKRTVVDESCNGAVDFGGGPDESASACKFGDSFVSVFHFCHGIQMQYVWVGKAYYSFCC